MGQAQGGGQGMGRAVAVQLEDVDLDLVVAPHEAAERIFARVKPGCRVAGLTMGQVSLIHLLRAILKQTGPADVVISAWTASMRDIETTAWLCATDQIRSLVFILDRSFPRMKPERARALVQRYGPSAILLTKTHAKFVLIRAGGWRLVLRGSMNLNTNPRMEQFDLDDSPALYAMYHDITDHLAREMKEGFADAGGSSDSKAVRLLRAAMAGNPDGIEGVFSPLETILRELAPDSTTHKPGGKPGGGRWGG